MRIPPCADILGQAQLNRQFIEKAKEPGFCGGNASAQRADIHDGSANSSLMEAVRCLDHKRGFPHLPRSQDVAIFTCERQPEQFLVRGAADVRRSFTPKRTAGDEEFLRSRWSRVFLHLAQLPPEEFSIQTTARSPLRIFLLD